MNFNTVLPGDDLVIPAATWNVMLADLQRRGPSGAGGLRDRFDRFGVLVLNSTGVDLDQGNVVGFTTPLIDSTTNLIGYLNSFAFTGVKASGGTRSSSPFFTKWGLTLEPIKNGGYGRVQIAGLAHCYINLNPSATIQFAGPDALGTVTSLVQADCGARVIWRAAGTGEQRAVVVL